MSTMSGKRILLVEDDKFLSELVAKRFVAEGVVMSYADNGKTALELLKDGAFDMIVLDVLLPEVSGFDILKNIKSTDRTKDVPVVLLSNLGQKEDVDNGMKLGANKFLIKAILSLDEIVSEISGVVMNK